MGGGSTIRRNHLEPNQYCQIPCNAPYHVGKLAKEFGNIKKGEQNQINMFDTLFALKLNLYLIGENLRAGVCKRRLKANVDCLKIH